jgi:hypothetical protein
MGDSARRFARHPALPRVPRSRPGVPQVKDLWPGGAYWTPSPPRTSHRKHAVVFPVLRIICENPILGFIGAMRTERSGWSEGTSLPVNAIPLWQRTSDCGRASAPIPPIVLCDRRTSSQPCCTHKIKPPYQNKIKQFYLSLPVWPLVSRKCTVRG